MKSALILVHRWLSILLLPLVLFLVVTGGILALRPIMIDLTSGPVAQKPMPVNQAADFIRQVDPEGRVRAMRLEEPTTIVLEFTRSGEREIRAFDWQEGLDLGERREGAEFFHLVADLHKHFVYDLEWQVEWASYGLLLIIVSGLFLAWPRLRRTVIGWHTVMGWASLPVVLVITATAVMLLLGIGGPNLPDIDRSPGRLALPTALDRAAGNAGLTHVHTVRTMQRAGVVVHGVAEGAPIVLVITRSEVSVVDAHPGLIDELHTGTWAGGWSGALYFVAMLFVLGLTGTGLWSWGRRHFQRLRRYGDATADVLIAWGSQTGTAARLGEATVKTLGESGIGVQGRSLAGIEPADLNAYKAVYLIVSTTGDGQMPEPARAFHAHLDRTQMNGVDFAILALGDRAYPRFCAAGTQLRDSLIAAGAREILPMVMVDRDPTTPWLQWLKDVATQLDISALDPVEIEKDYPVTLTLRARTQLNDPTDPDTSEVWALEMESETPLVYKPGDLLMLAPGAGTVPRHYSIGSSIAHDPHRVRLSVALVSEQVADGSVRLGAMSGRLCRELAIGETLCGTVRAHPGFNLPTDRTRPVIMVATGCGIAPFIGFIEDRAAGQYQGDLWLFFGNSKRQSDFLYGQQLEDWRKSGALTRLSTAFDRNPDDGAFIQDIMVREGDSIYQWLDERSAVLYVCGRVRTVGLGARTALATLVATHAGLPPDEAQALLRQWEGEGKLRFDLID